MIDLDIRTPFTPSPPLAAHALLRPLRFARHVGTWLLWTQLWTAGTDASVDYIRSYRGTPDTLDASLKRIRATAQRLANELDAIRFDAEHDPDPT